MNVEIEIPVSELKSVLPGLAKIIPRSTALPVLQCVKASLDKDGRQIQLQAHNLDEVATARLDNKANGLSGQLLVPLDMLTKIIKGCAPGQSIRLLSTGQETRIRYTVAGSPVDRLVSHIEPKEWPEVKDINSEPATLDESFKVALKEATECASEDSSRYVLNGACLDTRDKAAHYVVGTDGRHLFYTNGFRLNLPEPLIVPTRKFLSWPGFVEDGPWNLRMLPAVRKDPNDKNDKTEEQPAWFRIDSDRWTYLAKAIDGQYPNWRQVVPGDTAGWTQVSLHPTGVDTIINALPLLPGGDETDRSITLNAGNGLVLQAKSRDQADWTQISITDASITGKAVQVALNRRFLLQALRFGLHQIAIKGSLDPLVFSNQTKTMVVMPLRCEGPADVAPVKEDKSAVTQTASVAPPSAAPAPPSTEERNNMPRTSTTASTTTMTAPERDNLLSAGQTHGGNNGHGQPEGDDNRSALKTALEQMDRMKTNLRDIMGDLGDAISVSSNPLSAGCHSAFADMRKCSSSACGPPAGGQQRSGPFSGAGGRGRRWPPRDSQTVGALWPRRRRAAGHHHYAGG